MPLSSLLCSVLLGLFACSGSERPSPSSTDSAADSASSGGGGEDSAGGGEDTASQVEPPARFTCPEGSASLALDLSGAHAEAVAGVPTDGGSGFLEGPVWHAEEGALFLSQIFFHGSPNEARLLRYAPAEGFAVSLDDAGTNGLALDEAGALVAASHKQTGIVRLDVAASSAEVLVDRYDGARFNSPNDLTVAEDGTIYFTDPDWQCGGCAHQPVEGVYRLPPGGAPERLAEVTQDKPNGIALSPDGRTLYVGGSPQLTAHPVGEGGAVGAGQPLGVYGTDGLGVDCAGNVYVTADGAVVVLDASGAELGRIAAAQATNVAFGGPENRTLYITGFGDEAGTLRQVTLNVPGYPY